MPGNLAKPGRVSSLKDHTGFWLRFVSNHVSHAFARKLEASGVTVAEWVILREAYEQTTVSPSGLADLTGLTRGAVSKLVDRLVGKQLMSRADREEDRRFQHIALTPAGRDLLPKLGALADENDEEYFCALSPAERNELVAILKKLVRSNHLTKLPTE